jgi:hypothetical protein
MACRQGAICAVMIAAMQVKPIRLRDLRNVFFPSKLELYHAVQTGIDAPRH